MTKPYIEYRTSVRCDPDYYYEVTLAEDRMGVWYHEAGSSIHTGITFGSLEEMRAVATQMLKLIETANEDSTK